MEILCFVLPWDEGVGTCGTFLLLLTPAELTDKET